MRIGSVESGSRRLEKCSGPSAAEAATPRAWSGATYQVPLYADERKGLRAGGTIEYVDPPSPASDPEPRPWSAAWAITPAAARWRAAQPFPEANFVGNLTEPLDYPISLTALRPPKDAVPVLGPEAAYASAREHSHCPTHSGGPSIFLALADVRDRNDLLVYLLRWENVEWAPSGPPPRKGDRPRPVTAAGECIVLVDAITGASMGTMYTGKKPS